jgi:hypothetical protein
MVSTMAAVSLACARTLQARSSCSRPEIFSIAAVRPSLAADTLTNQRPASLAPHASWQRGARKRLILSSRQHSSASTSWGVAVVLAQEFNCTSCGFLANACRDLLEGL